tara:strand:+ start:192 stop:839 length:648 start_codon:yes stop_codon:yes gene_type:complete
MASEIRVNKINNRVGLGTVTYTDTGIIVSGIVTANSFKGDGSQLTGVTSVGGATGVDFNDNVKIRLGDSQDLQIYHDSNHSYIDDAGTGNLRLRSGTLEITNLASNKTSAVFSSGGGQTLNFNNSTKFVTTNTGAIVTGVLTATSFSGDGSSLSNLPAGAPVGGASTNTVFFENDKAVAVNYQITSTKNAMSAGPISINAGIAVTVPSGCSWTIV